MKWLSLLGLLALTGCGRDTETRYVTSPATMPSGYTVKAEVRECDGKLLVDLASLETSDGLALRAVNATTRKTTKDEWEIVLEFGDAKP